MYNSVHCNIKQYYIKGFFLDNSPKNDEFKDNENIRNSLEALIGENESIKRKNREMYYEINELRKSVLAGESKHSPLPLFDHEKEIHKSTNESIQYSTTSGNKDASSSKNVVSAKLNKKLKTINVAEGVVKTIPDAKKIHVVKMALETNEVQQPDTSNKPMKTFEDNSGHLLTTMINPIDLEVKCTSHDLSKSNVNLIRENCCQETTKLIVHNELKAVDEFKNIKSIKTTLGDEK